VINQDLRPRLSKHSTVPTHRLLSPAHSSTSPSTEAGIASCQKDRAGLLYQATGTSQRPGQHSNKIFTARDPTVFAKNEELSDGMVELPVECRPSVHQDEAGKSSIHKCSKRNPAFLSPVTVEPIIGVSTIRADFTIRRSDFRKFGEIILIKLDQIRDDLPLAHRHLGQSHGKLHRSHLAVQPPRARHAHPQYRRHLSLSSGCKPFRQGYAQRYDQKAFEGRVYSGRGGDHNNMLGSRDVAEYADGYVAGACVMTIEINGIAHVILTVSRFDLARAFYRKLLPEFGMKPVYDGEKFFYCVGARTAIGIEPCDPALAGERFVQQRVGLHHLCLRARSREDVDRCASLLKEMEATIVRGPVEGSWAPGYYYVLFEDPGGIRLEVNFVPGAGLLADGTQFNPGTGCA
jgi:catechol 2,3-dioxygenase-like lactoylglutathione lyase family enzyme